MIKKLNCDPEAYRRIELADNPTEECDFPQIKSDNREIALHVETVLDECNGMTETVLGPLDHAAGFKISFGLRERVLEERKKLANKYRFAGGSIFQ